ncbi:MAG: ABC transporter substrate-binding protein [Acetatifactor sp.]|nr:ABC transporter substrate-binding protein [Acetatifactor sp.]
MKRFKKLVGVAMASAMVFSMAGCGDSNGSGNGSGNADATTFKIGGTGPLTGGAAAYGQAVQNAAQLAVDEINANGGVNGYMLELNYQDDEHNAEKAVNAYNTLKDWGVQIVLGSVTSAPCIAVVDKTKEDNIFQLTPSGTAVECTKYDNAFRVCFSDPAQGTVSAQYIGENNLASKIAIIYDSSDTYSSGIYENFAKEAEKYSFEIVCAEAFTEDSNTDFSVQLQKAKDSGADMVFLPIYYEEAALILTQANGMGFAPIFFGVDGMDGILSGVDNFDASLAEDVMFLTPFAATSTETDIVNFVTAYKEKFGETPNQFAADAYDGVYIIKDLIEKSGVKPSDDTATICSGLKEAITNGYSFDGLTGTGITWSADGEPNKAPSVVVIKGGVYNQL